MGKKPHISPFSIFHYSPFIFTVCTLHFPFSFLIILIISVPLYLTFILTIFLKLTPSSFPLPASLFPPFLQPSLSRVCPPSYPPTPPSPILSLPCLSLPLRCQITVYTSACPVITFFTQPHPLIGPVSSYHIM